MDVLLLPSTTQKPQEKRSLLPWAKKNKPITSSILFNKTKHSDEWHQGIDATAGVLHPSDGKFPWGYVRNHTDTYLRKKGKLNQTDADVRLAILVDSHDAKDIAIAAVAHAMTAKSLRALLHADLNVAQGSYWGLKEWLQCLIAANSENSASVTDLEALYARKLLPFATHGSRAAEWYLIGISRTLMEISIPNMNVLPEFLAVLRRAIADHSAQLERYRLGNQWAAAYEAVQWMKELAKVSPIVTPPGHLLPEHILDSQFPVWRLWAKWQPDVNRISQLASLDRDSNGILSDFLSLDGPDILTGSEKTLGEALIEHYSDGKSFLQFRRLVVQITNNDRNSLRLILDRVALAMEKVHSTSPAGHSPHSKLALFQTLFITKPITDELLDVFDATTNISGPPGIDVCRIMQHICRYREQLGGADIAYLHALTNILEIPDADDLRGLLYQSWLFSGIEKCLVDCRKAVRAQIEGHLPWIDLSLELHAFCNSLKNSRFHFGLKQAILNDFVHLPHPEVMTIVADVLAALRSVDPGPPVTDALIASSNLKDHIRSGDRLDRGSPNGLEDQEGEPKFVRHPLHTAIEAFCIDRLLERGAIDQSAQRTMTLILHIWKTTSVPSTEKHKRSLAILITKVIGDDTTLQHKCLAAIASENNLLSSGASAEDFIEILKLVDIDLSQAIISFTRLLCKMKNRDECWQTLLFTWLERQCSTPASNKKTVLEDSLESMKAKEWLAFMESIERIFIDLPVPIAHERPRPPILQPSLLAWKSEVAGFEEPISRLESVLGNDLAAIRCILACKTWSKNLLAILNCLRDAQGKTTEKLMQRIIGRLSAKNVNDWEIKHCCVDLSFSSQESIDMCYKLWDASCGRLDLPGLSQAETDLKITGAYTSPKKYWEMSREVPPAVVEVMLAGWIQDESIVERDKVVFQSLATLLGIEIYHLSVPEETLNEAVEFWAAIEEEMIKEAERLEVLQKALKAKDPKGTTLLLQQLGIPDHSELDEELARLPLGIIEYAERIGDTQIELSFPIASLTELQREASGISKTAKTVLIRLSMDFKALGIPPSFCVHFDDDNDLETLEHSHWECKKDANAPELQVCKSAQTSFTWQMNRILHMQLRDSDISLVELYNQVKKRINEMGHHCVACGTSHQAKNAQLRRATPCNIIACAQLWYRLPLDVRIPEIRTDLFAVDVMLMSVYAAAMSNRPELLAGCPIKGFENVKAILNILPTLKVLSHAVNLSTVLQSYHQDAEKLISWACIHHRGYIATARGICKIPTMTNVHQFVLANASPKLESEFMAKLPRHNPKTTVLFHGTTFDRLPAILSQGLRVCSGTALQRTGAAHGKGIYLAEDPATSLTYAPTTMSWKNSSLSHTRLLLGCEVIGNGRSVSSTIHVVTDEKSVMVRYLFLLPLSVSAPLANHIVPAMASGMSALRTGTI